MKEAKIKVLALLPMELPKEIELDNALEAMQNFVGRLIECIPLTDTGSEITLVCNDEGIMVNHWGTIILAEPLKLPDDGRRYIDEEADWNYSPLDTDHTPSKTVQDFQNRYCV